MAMLLDGPPATIADLTVRDSDLLDVCETEGIDLTAKLQMVAVDVQVTVDSLLSSMQPCYSWMRERFPSLRHIAVTAQLKLWYTFATLRSVYQDLYYSRLNDRYQAKMKMFREEETGALDDLRTVGLGVVHDPLPQAVAPTVVMVPSTDAGGTVYLAVTYVNQRGEQGLASLPVEADIPANNSATVSLSSLAENAQGWNLFAGVSPGPLYQQNTQTLGPLATVTVAADTLGTGPMPGVGQHANVLYPIPRRILRG
jgi:hypothetical protein